MEGIIYKNIIMKLIDKLKLKIKKAELKSQRIPYNKNNKPINPIPGTEKNEFGNNRWVSFTHKIQDVCSIYEN